MRPQRVEVDSLMNTRKKRADVELGDALTYKLYRVHKQIDRISQTSYLEGSGLPLSEGRCLATIGTFGPFTLRELAERANLHAGQASRAAQKLFDKGLITKVQSASDARELRITLTEKGTTIWHKVMGVIHDHNTSVFACLSDAERDALSTILSKVIDATAR